MIPKYFWQVPTNKTAASLDRMTEAIKDIPDVYFPNSKELCKHINHRFYKLGPFMMTDFGQLERNTSIVDIDHIDIFFGKENK